MKVDRSRFLMLTGALSAATAVVLSGAAGCSSTSTETKVDASAPTDSGSTDATTGDASTDGSVDSGVVACLNDTTDAGDPDAGDGGLDCMSNADLTCQAICQGAFTNLKAGIALEAADCLLKLPTCEGNPDAADCVKKAGAKACADPTSAPLCASVIATCTDAGTDPDGGPALSQADCVKFVNTLSAAGRDTFVACMTEGGGCIDPTSCTL